MKALILLSFILSSILTFSQISQPVVTTFKTNGYIGGIRLDSIDAQFAEFTLTWQKEVRFDYGQWRKKAKELTITDSRGTPLIFETGGRAFLLNFFYFNGWQVSPAPGDSSLAYSVLLTKR